MLCTCRHKSKNWNCIKFEVQFYKISKILLTLQPCYTEAHVQIRIVSVLQIVWSFWLIDQGLIRYIRLHTTSLPFPVQHSYRLKGYHYLGRKCCISFHLHWSYLRRFRFCRKHGLDTSSFRRRRWTYCIPPSTRYRWSNEVRSGVCSCRLAWSDEVDRYCTTSYRPSHWTSTWRRPKFCRMFQIRLLVELELKDFLFETNERENNSKWHIL